MCKTKPKYCGKKLKRNVVKKKMETKCCKTKAKCYKKWKQNVCEIKILKT